jgi:hypothetical protein
MRQQTSQKQQQHRSSVLGAGTRVEVHRFDSNVAVRGKLQFVETKGSDRVEGGW